MKKIVMFIACVVFATSCFSLNSFAIGPADRIERRVDHRDNATDPIDDKQDRGAIVGNSVVHYSLMVFLNNRENL